MPSLFVIFVLFLHSNFVINFNLCSQLQMCDAHYTIWVWVFEWNAIKVSSGQVHFHLFFIRAVICTLHHSRATHLPERWKLVSMLCVYWKMFYTEIELCLGGNRTDINSILWLKSKQERERKRIKKKSFWKRAIPCQFSW